MALKKEKSLPPWAIKPMTIKPMKIKPIKFKPIEFKPIKIGPFEVDSDLWKLPSKKQKKKGSWF